MTFRELLALYKLTCAKDLCFGDGSCGLAAFGSLFPAQVMLKTIIVGRMGIATPIILNSAREWRWVQDFTALPNLLYSGNSNLSNTNL